MSTIGSVGSGKNLLWLLQLSARQQTRTGTAGFTQGSQGMGPPPGGGPERLVDDVVSASGLQGDEATALSDELTAAIEDAIENAGDSDPREAVKTAVQSVLEERGLDADQIMSELEPPGGTPPPPPQGGQGGGPEQLINDVTEASGVEGDEATELSDLLAAAIEEATESSESRDPGEAAMTAVQSVLEERGLDADQIMADLEAFRPAPPDGGMATSVSNQTNLLASLLGSDGTTSGYWQSLSLLNVTA